ncbi:helix-turn-helix domain-containing protein [Flavobacterium wongokense]|uniref:helix-turn-helix domain-containing protein n=1 Tax=Flavobacterium wongokense TaxID=2910674 RepID=UPI001F1EE53D|nr:helix-turn-helix domain-containing protein [Flavobacterium sp. WG47]MCF6131987.1 helix-turn-helix domain-containing protein [Flavobacterium sp. WG47]
MKIYIRNMACESCKVVLRDALIKLNIQPVKIELGEAEIKGDLTDAKKQKLDALINKVGLQIVENKGEILIEKVKHYCKEYVISEKLIKVNISEYLSHKLDKDYNYLSNLFSEVESCTIVHYINLLKVEKAKEMILFEDYNFSEIAAMLNFNNLSAFSTQFKKITGYNPTHFKKLKNKRRLTVQELTKKKQ